MLYIDIVCINYDGNAFDAAVLAVMTALRNSQSLTLFSVESLEPELIVVRCHADGEIAKLPVAQYDEDLDQTICSRTEMRELKDEMRAVPLACTFGIFDK